MDTLVQLEILRIPSLKIVIPHLHDETTNHHTITKPKTEFIKMMLMLLKILATLSSAEKVLITTV